MRNVAKESTMAKVEAEISQGKLGIARDRLHGLIDTYACDLTLRSRLGDVYFKLGYPAMAGRFWYLDSDLDAEKETAVAAFLRECGNNSAAVLRRLKIRCEPEMLSDPEAGKRVTKMLAECEAKSYTPPNFWPKKSKSCDRIFGLACAAITLALLALVIVGFVTAWEWFFSR